MKQLPVRDEQGSRDRPHYLRIAADAALQRRARLRVSRELLEAGLTLALKPLRSGFVLI
jgi:hypothetical protein